MHDPTSADLSSRRKATILLVCIVLAGLAIRLVHFWLISSSAMPFRHLMVTTTDDHAFYQWARSIVAGDWLGRETYHPYFPWMQDIAPLETWYRWWGGKEIFQQAPLYPYVLAVLLGVTRYTFASVLLIQLLIGALQPLLMYFLAKRLWNYRVGLIAALLTALYGPFVFYQGVFLRDGFAPIVETLALVAVLKASERDSPRSWLLAGAALGLALLAREMVQLLILLVLIWIFMSRRANLGQAVRVSSWMLMGLLLALSPLLLRNVAVGAPVFAVSNRAAEGIIEGWAADGFPVGLFHPPSMKGILSVSDGRVTGVIARTAETYRGDWAKFLGHVVTKLRAIGDSFEFPNNISFYYGMDVSPVLRFMLGYWFVFPLGVTGLLLSLKTWKVHAIGLIYVLAAIGGLLTAVILSRYRLDLAAALILYAAWSIVYLVDATRQKREWQKALSLGLAAAVAVAQQFVLPVGPEVKDYPYTVDYTASAAVYAEIHQYGWALDEIDRALQKVSEYPYFNEPDILLWLRHYYRAQQFIETGNVEAAREETDIAHATMVPHADTLLALAKLYVRLKDRASAQDLLETILELDPNGRFAADARRMLAELSS